MFSLRTYATPLLLVVSCATALGCGSKGAVSLVAQLEGAHLAVEPGPLVTRLSGGFELILDLGSLAPRETQVQHGPFAVRRDTTVLIEALRLSSTEPFPVAVAPGAQRTLAFTLEPSASVEASAADAICAGSVFIEGTLTDTLSEGRVTPVRSGDFLAECP